MFGVWDVSHHPASKQSITRAVEFGEWVLRIISGQKESYKPRCQILGPRQKQDFLSQNAKKFLGLTGQTQLGACSQLGGASDDKHKRIHSIKVPKGV